MHIKKLLSGSLAGLMIASSINVPMVQAGEVDETTVIETPTETAEEDETIPVEESDDVVVVDEPTVEETPVVEQQEAVTQETQEESADIQAVEEEQTQEVVNESEAVELTADMVTLSADTAVYSGTDQKPSVTIDDATESTDYTVEWKKGEETVTELVDAGTYTLTVTPIAESTALKGSAVNKEFTITAKTLENAVVNVSDITYGDAAPEVIVKDSSEETAATVDASNYTLTYKYKATEQGEFSEIEAAKIKNAGIYQVTATFNGNYSGTAVGTFNINEKEITADDITIAGSTVLTYKDGEAQAVEPEITLSSAFSELNSNDYTVTYSNNTAVGTATLTLELNETDTSINYKTAEGGVKKTFEITEDSSVSKSEVTKKAGFNTVGTRTNTLASGRVSTEDIKAITGNSIPTAIVNSPEGKAAFKAAVKLYYSDNQVVENGSNAEDDSVVYTVEVGEIGDGATEATYTITLTGTEYGANEGDEEGSSNYVLTGTVKVVEEKEYNAADYNILVVDKVATFNQAGSFHYANELGTQATTKTGDVLTPSDADASVSNISYDVPQLQANFEGNATEYTYAGKEILPNVVVKTKGLVESTDDEGNTTTVFDAVEYTNSSDGSTPVTVSYEDATKPGTAKAFVQVKDANGLYYGETSLAYTIVADKETIETPYSVESIDISNVSYGTKVRIATKTTGAKIYYTVSDTDNATPADPTAESTQYKSAITLTSDMAKDNVITIKAIAIKGDSQSEVATFTYTMLAAATDWGDIDLADQSQWADATAVPEGLWIGTASITDDGLTYTGKAQTVAELRVYYHKTLLTEKTDYTLKYANNKNAWVVGDTTNYPVSKQPTITVTGKGKFSGTFTQGFAIDPMTVYPSVDLTGYTGCYNQYLSTGKLVQPNAKVTTTDWNGTKRVTKTYTKNKDYTIEYFDSYNIVGGNATTTELTVGAGTKYAVVTMKGNYKSGAVSTPYTVIDSATSITKTTKISMPSKAKWTGKDIDMNLVITDKSTGATLVKDTDYTVYVSCNYYDGTVNETYGNPIQKSYSKTEAVAKPVGTYYVYITGMGDYSGTVSKTFTVTGTAISVNNLSAAQYTGSAITPTVTVKAAGKVLENTDTTKNYVVYYINNQQVGTASAIVYPNNDLGYSGTVIKTFKIVGTKLAANQVTLDKTSIIYDGTIPEVSDFGVVVKDGTTTLTAGADYNVMLFDKFDAKDSSKWKFATAEAGTKTMVISGIGKYDGSYITKKVTVTPVDLAADAKLTEGRRVSNPRLSSATCTKAGAQPKVTLVDGFGTTETTDDVTLVNGTDYTVTYKNNTVVAAADAKKAPTATIKGKGNYTGTITVNFAITSGSLSDATIVTTDITEGKFKAPKTTVTLGKALAVKKDYTLTYVYNETAVITRNNEKVTVYRNDEVKTGDVLTAGTELRAVATAGTNGDYVGTTPETEGIIRVVAKNMNISSAKFKINDQTYAGSPVLLTADDFATAAIGSTNLVLGTDFEIVEGSYVNNAKAGTAKVTVRGIGNYGGTKTLSFKIKAKSMLYNLTFEAVSQTFGTGDEAKTLNPTGATKALTSKNGTFTLPQASFKVDGKTYVFEGWYSDKELTSRVGEKGTSYTPSINAGETATLYAKYEEVGEYKIIFDGNAPTGVTPTGKMSDQTIKRGTATAISANKLKRAGYKFVGWKVRSGEGTEESPYTYGTTVYTDKQKLYNEFATGTNTILSAQWEAISYKVTYKDAENLTTDIYTTEDGIASIPTPVKAGYTFTGWKCSNAKALLKKTTGEGESAVTTYSIAAGTIGDLTLTPVWTQNEFTVKYNNNAAAYTTGEGESAVCALGNVSGTMATQEKIKSGTKLAANAFKVTGAYKFVGWSKTTGTYSTAEIAYADKAVVKEASDSTVTLYAVWAPIDYKITYSGAAVTTAAPTSYNVENAASVLASAQAAGTTVTKSGKTLVWDVYVGKTKLDADGIAALATSPKAITLKARWEDATYPYTVKFEANAPTNQTVSGEMNDLENANAGTKLTANAFTITNYAFKGWATSAEGAVKYEDEAALTDVMNEEGKTLTLYAVWEKLAITCKFEKNDDSEQGSDTIDDIEYITGTSDSKYPACPWTKTGYTFAGWVCAADAGPDGNQELTVYAANATINLGTVTAAGSRTYTPSWTPITRTINYNANEGTGSVDAGIYTYGETFEASDGTGLIAPEGKTFKGWGATSDATDVISDWSSYAPTDDDIEAKTVYAIWK
ncbi:FN3 associated domain-containing protein [Pseudobutyrivibrio ruminis]|uniref:Listeria/Bacterioides repeat-containing protein n=1 Tax=Pseudobutyrivibrio ruminis DSM 9787 TaxID=1123011 RepID=A0A285S8V0_9FIRM|nr:InlB B-repeat-containing protein [Pseudobutyrivibrio ruminis]SOC04020.1 Listeria/Bacterioides repeat-containing protein [Pseudobutyrivibrio ruminis DSM 9787]